MNIEKRVSDLEKRVAAMKPAEPFNMRDWVMLEGEDGTREEMEAHALEVIARTGKSPVLLFRPTGWAEGAR